MVLESSRSITESRLNAEAEFKPFIEDSVFLSASLVSCEFAFHSDAEVDSNFSSALPTRVFSFSLSSLT